jgi:hypothetical protein
VANTRDLEQTPATCFQCGKSNAVAFDDSKSELINYINSHNSDNSNETQVELLNKNIIASSQV